jgi:hypothetical protein
VSDKPAHSGNVTRCCIYPSRMRHRSTRCATSTVRTSRLTPGQHVRAMAHASSREVHPLVNRGAEPIGRSRLAQLNGAGNPGWGGYIDTTPHASRSLAYGRSLVVYAPTFVRRASSACPTRPTLGMLPRMGCRPSPPPLRHARLLIAVRASVHLTLSAMQPGTAERITPFAYPSLSRPERRLTTPSCVTLPC